MMEGQDAGSAHQYLSVLLLLNEFYHLFLSFRSHLNSPEDKQSVPFGFGKFCLRALYKLINYTALEKQWLIIEVCQINVEMYELVRFHSLCSCWPGAQQAYLINPQLIEFLERGDDWTHAV